MKSRFSWSVIHLTVSSLITQIAFGTLVFAQTVPPQPTTGYGDDPFWSNNQPGGGGTLDPNNGHFWNTGTGGGTNPGTTGTKSPWNYGEEPPWDPSGPGGAGGWGDPNNPSADPYGVYQTWGTMGPNNPKPTDGLWVKFIRYSGVLSKDYAGMIQELRTSTGFDNDDFIADRIIKEASRRTALTGASVSFIASLTSNKLGGDPNSGGFGYGDIVGALGLPVESVALIIQQMTMVLELAALYGELPTDEDQRTDLASIAFSAALAPSFTNKFVIQKFLTEGTIKAVAEAVAAKMVTNVGAKIVVESGAAAIGVAVAAEAAASVTTTQVTKGWFTKFVSYLAVPVTLASKAIVTGTVDWGATLILGKIAKKTYRNMALAHKAKAILAINSEPKAKHALWLVLSRDVFQPTFMNAEDSSHYAAVVDQMMPLIRTDRWDELKSMNDDYRNHIVIGDDKQARSTIIDDYLLYLGKYFPTHSKLYLVQMVLAGMLMKGGLTDHDNRVLDTMAIELSLLPPPKIDPNRYPPNDKRKDAVGRYLQMRQRMVDAVAMAEKYKADSKRGGCASTTAHRGHAGQIIYEDFYQTDIVVKNCKDKTPGADTDACIAEELQKEASVKKLCVSAN